MSSKKLNQWIKKNITLLFNAGSLIGTTMVNSGLGFIFWWVAARQFPVEAVGISSASFAAMNLAGTFCILGMGTLLITEIPRKPEQARALTSTALLIVSCAGVIVGIGIVILIPILAPDLLILRANITNAIIFVLGISLTSLVLVLDQALIGFLRGGVQLWRNIFFSIFKLGLLIAVAFLFVTRTGIQIYAAWALANVLSLLALAGTFKRGSKNSSKHTLRDYLPQLQLARKMGLPGLQHHMLNMALQAPTLILPLLVTVLLSARSNAWFYIAWQLSNFVFMVPTALTTVLHATNSARPQSLGQKMRVTIGMAVATGLLANLVIQLFPQLILGFFGARYAQEASWCLRILALAVFPLTIKNHYISVCRIYDRITSAMFGMIPGGLLELGAAALGAYFGGLSGLSLGWLGAMCVEALFMTPTIIRVLRSKEAPSKQTEAADADQQLWQVDTVMMPAIGTNYVALEAAWRQTEKMRALRASQKMPAVTRSSAKPEPNTSLFTQAEQHRIVQSDAQIPAIGPMVELPISKPDFEPDSQPELESDLKSGLKPTQIQQHSPRSASTPGKLPVLSLPSKSPSEHSLLKRGSR